MTEPKIMWWGYLHLNGKPQLKRWWGDHKDYRDDCIGNPFVLKVVAPFEADTYDEALTILKQRLEASSPDAKPPDSSTTKVQ